MFLFKAEKILKTLFSNTTLLVRPLYFDTTETRSAYDSVQCNCTGGENIITTIKIRNIFFYPLKMLIFPILQ